MFNFFSIMELMTRRSYLGEFELMLLLTVIHLGDGAYGVPIACELESHRRRSVSVSSVYAALERLEDAVPLAHPGEDEVCLARDEFQAEGGEARLEAPQAPAGLADAGLGEGAVIERGRGRRLRDRVHVEGLADPVEERRQLGACVAVADAQRREAVDL